MELEDLTEKVIGCAITVHKTIGPGFLESSVEILEGIVRAQAIIGISGGFEGEICSNDEQFNGVSVCFGSLSGTVKTSAVWGIWENSYNYVWDDFNTCEK